MTPDMRLEAHEIRAKVIELLDGMDAMRMDLWLSSGIIAGVIDPDIFALVMHQEVVRRSQHVQEYWLEQPCDCGERLT